MTKRGWVWIQTIAYFAVLLAMIWMLADKAAHSQEPSHAPGTAKVEKRAADQLLRHGLGR